MRTTVRKPLLDPRIKVVQQPSGIASKRGKAPYNPGTERLNTPRAVFFSDFYQDAVLPPRPVLLGTFLAIAVL